MKSLFWFVFGIAGGFVLAHLVDKDPRGQKVLAEIDARIGEFTDRMGDAYREQEARFSGPIAGDDTGPSDSQDLLAPTPREVAEHTSVPQVHALADGDAADRA